jgi:hypothetical protein
MVFIDYLARSHIVVFSSRLARSKALVFSVSVAISFMPRDSSQDILADTARALATLQVYAMQRTDQR